MKKIVLVLLSMMTIMVEMHAMEEKPRSSVGQERVLRKRKHGAKKTKKRKAKKQKEATGQDNRAQNEGAREKTVDWQNLSIEAKQLIFAQACKDEPKRSLRTLNSLKLVDKETAVIVTGIEFLDLITSDWVTNNSQCAEMLFLTACRHNKTKEFDAFMRARVSVNIRDKRGMSPLQYAVRYSAVDKVKALLKRGVRVENVLWYCTHKKVARLLLKSGVLIAARTHLPFHEQSALDYELLAATLSDQAERVGELLKLGADPNACSSSDGMTPLMIAASIGALEIVKHLIDGKADVNKSLEFFSPLSQSIEGRHYDVLELLLARGADAKVQGKTTPLIVAIKSYNKRMAKKLIKHGADVNMEDCIHYTPLMYAAQSGAKSLVTFLLKHGASADKERAILCAKQAGRQDIADYLVKF
jgi:ankyrin repeat protein